jgi:hypothetical protein
MLDFPDRREIGFDVNSTERTSAIFTMLESSLILKRLPRTPEPLNIGCRHLEEYLETNIREKESKA